MNSRNPAPSSEAPLRQDLLYALRYYLGGRRAWLALAALAGLGGLVLNWNWLVVIGVAPLLIAVLPCVAMCALGLCMMGRSSSSEQPTGTGAQPERDARLRGEHAIPPLVSVEETDGPLAQVEYSDPPTTMQSFPKRGRTTRPSPTVFSKPPSKGKRRFEVNRKTLTYAGVGAAAIVAGLLFNSSFGVSETTVAKLAEKTHVHGIAVDPKDPSRLMIATHHGFHIASPDGAVNQVSETSDDFMGFTPHPTDGSILYASGHPGRGGNLGFIESTDGGRTWHQLSGGAAEYGAVDFHMMDVSKADPAVVYGVYRELQVSRDGGRTWQTVDVPPRRIIDLAASAKDPNTVYAATEGGLQISMDGGKSWQATKVTGQPVALVEVAADGRIFAFVVGTGLLQGKEGSPKWETLSADFGDRILLHLAADPSNADRLYAVTQESEVLASQDGGKTWQPFGPTS